MMVQAQALLINQQSEDIAQLKHLVGVMKGNQLGD